MPWWVKVDADIDDHPKACAAGFDACALFQFFLRVNGRRDLDGRIPRAYWSTPYLTRKTGLDAETVEARVRVCIEANLLAVDGDDLVIVGWDDEWTVAASTNAERQARFRDRRRNGGITESNGPLRERYEERNGSKREVTRNVDRPTDRSQTDRAPARAPARDDAHDVDIDQALTQDAVQAYTEAVTLIRDTALQTPGMRDDLDPIRAEQRQRAEIAELQQVVSRFGVTPATVLDVVRWATAEPYWRTRLPFAADVSKAWPRLVGQKAGARTGSGPPSRPDEPQPSKRYRPAAEVMREVLGGREARNAKPAA